MPTSFDTKITKIVESMRRPHAEAIREEYINAIVEALATKESMDTKRNLLIAKYGKKD